MIEAGPENRIFRPLGSATRRAAADASRDAPGVNGALRRLFANPCTGMQGPRPRAGLTPRQGARVRSGQAVASTFSNCQGSLSSISSANCGQRVEIGVQSV